MNIKFRIALVASVWSRPQISLICLLLILVSIIMLLYMLTVTVETASPKINKCLHF